MTYPCCRHCLHDGDPGEDPENAHTERCPYSCNDQSPGAAPKERT